MIFAELMCIAITVYFEARNQPLEGQAAVAHVVLNRVASKRHPNTPCEVMTDGGETKNRCQFSFYCDGRSERIFEPRAWSRANEVATLVAGGLLPDPVNGATHYHARSVQPYWAAKLKHAGTVGNHIFYIEE